MPETKPRRPERPDRAGRRPGATAGFVAVGLIVAPWGVRGDVKVEPLTDFPDRFRPGAPLWLQGQRVSVQRSRSSRGYVYLALEGVSTRQDAEALRQRLLEVPEAELKPLRQGQYYHFQLVGLEVFTTNGRGLGRVEEILSTGANDVFIVRGPAGEILLPAIDDVVREVDLEGRRMVVEPLEEV